MNVLFIADVVGNTGKWVLSKMLQPIREEFSIDFCVANGENIAGGKGLTKNLFLKLKRFGVDVVTSGNHVWDNQDILSVLDTDISIIRPLNYPEGNPGKGSTIVSLPNGTNVGVVNLQGRVYMPIINCPFTTGLKEVQSLRKHASVILVDFHAEVTSEKIAMGWYLDGKVSAVICTHTHVQSADERILPNGTAYITDAGMTGARDSIIGMKKELIIRKFLLQSYVRYEPASEDPVFNGVFIEIDENTGMAKRIERIFRTVS